MGSAIPRRSHAIPETLIIANYGAFLRATFLYHVCDRVKEAHIQRGSAAMEGEKAHQLPDVQERGSESAEAQDVNMAAIKEKRAGDRPDCFNSTLQEILFVLTCTMAVSMTSFTVGAVIVITDQVGKDLGMSNAELTWISAASS